MGLGPSEMVNNKMGELVYRSTCVCVCVCVCVYILYIYIYIYIYINLIEGDEEGTFFFFLNSIFFVSL